MPNSLNDKIITRDVKTLFALKIDNDYFSEYAVLDTLKIDHIETYIGEGFKDKNYPETTTQYKPSYIFKVEGKFYASVDPGFLETQNKIIGEFNKQKNEKLIEVYAKRIELMKHKLKRIDHDADMENLAAFSANCFNKISKYFAELQDSRSSVEREKLYNYKKLLLDFITIIIPRCWLHAEDINAVESFINALVEVK